MTTSSLCGAVGIGDGFRVGDDDDGDDDGFIVGDVVVGALDGLRVGAKVGGGGMGVGKCDGSWCVGASVRAIHVGGDVGANVGCVRVGVVDGSSVVVVVAAGDVVVGMNMLVIVGRGRGRGREGGVGVGVGRVGANVGEFVVGTSAGLGGLDAWSFLPLLVLDDIGGDVSRGAIGEEGGGGVAAAEAEALPATSSLLFPLDATMATMIAITTKIKPSPTAIFFIRFRFNWASSESSILSAPLLLLLVVLFCSISFFGVLDFVLVIGEFNSIQFNSLL